MRKLAVFLVCPFFCGCMAFAYPSITETPTIKVEEPDVQAFRVYSDKTITEFSCPPFDITSSVTKLDTVNKSIASESKVYFPYYYLAFVLGEGSHSESLEVRLYRRGYETVSFPAVSWLNLFGHRATPKWRKLEKLEDLEKAIDDICVDRSGRSEEFQEVRRFVAQEYTWLADSDWAAGPDKSVDRERLLSKASECK